MVSHSTDLSHLPYRQNVGLVIINKEGLVFGGQRFDTTGAWQMPQGGIDEGEDILSAVYRELKEETGLLKEHANILQIAPKQVTYEFPPHLRKKLFQEKYRGQSQTWVALEFLGEDKDIDINADETPEFKKWQWFSFEELLRYIVPFKRDVYLEVQEFFKDHLK